MECSNTSLEIAPNALDGGNRHICAFFSDMDEHYRVLQSFIKDGFDQGVGEPGCHGGRVPAGPYSRDRRKRDQIPQRGLQAEELGVGIDVHLVRNAGASMRLLLP